MIKFFRQIRQSLLQEGKTGKYFKYAVGEIVLVVFGILIALSINNWNGNRIKKQEEQHYLKDLKTEFESNLNILNDLTKRSNSYFENARQLSKYLSSDTLTPTETEFNQLLFNSIIPEIQYRPVPGTLNEILTTGRLELISNSQLRNKLSAWEGLLLKVRFQEEEHGSTRLSLLEMVYRQGNFRKAYFDTQYKKFDMGKGKNPSSNLIFLNDAEFDNRLSGFFLTGKYLNEQYYGDLITHIEEILEIMNKEIGTD